MYCNKCGNEILENAAFCGHCGERVIKPLPVKEPEYIQTPVPPPAPIPPMPVQPVQAQPVPPKPKGNKKPIIIAVLAVCMVAVLAGLGFFAFEFITSGIIRGDKGKEETTIPVNNSDETAAQIEGNITYESTTAAPTTEPPTATVPQSNLLPSMSQAEKRALNVFLSNFSEAYLYEYDRSNINNIEMLSFAFIHNRINNSSRIVTQGELEGISGTNANNTLDKYFGISIPLETYKTESSWTDWVYEDGYFMTTVGAGDAYTAFSVATKMVDNGDGTYTVSLKVLDTFDYYYTDDYFYEYDPSLDVYALSESEAESIFPVYYTGTAIVTKKVYNGKSTYELQKYTTTPVNN